ncbi:hypothetical protein BC937DRAFT_86667 [Endogone sp. FLAS-F59071]|nr:hypothetical protein BC937DRAFT_86667 [Endogone sp. FLAS-F59071]|eukprot:RUS19952.1 hypothetical protein BC937DRAFT_86667 [Endogone sp. FLAS-F59071]
MNVPKSKRRRNIFYDDDEEELLLSLITADVFSGSEERKGSCVGRNPNLPRVHQEGHLRIMKDYFNDDPVYNDKLFR